MMFLIITDSLSDCTNTYEVNLEGKKYTVEEFIQMIFTERPNEWGNIEIYGIDVINYRGGKIVSQHFNNDLLNKPVKHVIAYGGWSRMDYVIYL
jgi:hypothetical protein